jgi:putative transposase
MYHVINRANGRARIFSTDADYRLFEELLNEGKEQFDMRILAYTIMSNHWHLLLHPREDGDVGRFMHWLTTTHATRYHSQKKTVGGGHVYQGRYKSFLVDTDRYCLTVLKYIERNPVRNKGQTLSK